MCGCEVTVTRIAARPDALACQVERAVDRRESLGLQHEPNAAPLRNLVRMSEESESRDVGHRVRRNPAQHVRGVLVERAHPTDRALELHRACETFLVTGHDQPRPERFRQEDRIADASSVLRPDPVRVNGADDGEPVLRLRVADGVSAREQRTGRAHLRVGRGEELSEHLHRKLLRKRGDRQREQRRPAHREHVVERIRRGDRTVIGSVVDDRREEVEREDQRAFVVEPVDRCIVGRRESDEQIFCVGGNETREQLLEPRGRVLRSTSSTCGEVGQFHSAGLGVQVPPPVRLNSEM